MEKANDIFSEGWSDGNTVNDGREPEALPEEDGGADKDAPENEAAAAGPGEDGEMEAQFVAFVRRFPGIRGEDIPREVWEAVRRGETLTEAYLESETARLRAENEALRAIRDRRELNLSRSAGSQTGTGVGSEKRDAFEEGWDMS